MDQDHSGDKHAIHSVAEQPTRRTLAELQEQPAPSGAQSNFPTPEEEAVTAAFLKTLDLQPVRPTPPRLIDLLQRAVPHLPAVAAKELLDMTKSTTTNSRIILRNIEDWLNCNNREEEEECALGAWLCLAAMSGEIALLGSAVTRAAHALLAMAPHAARALDAALLAALPEPRARVRLADSLRSDEENSDALAQRLVYASLAELLKVSPKFTAEECKVGAVRWTLLSAEKKLAVLQLATRLRAWAPPGTEAGPARLMAALIATPLPAIADSQAAHKVLTMVSRLRFLYPE